MLNFWAAGDVASAQKEAAALAADHDEGSGDFLIRQLELASVARTNGDLRTSVDSLKKSDKKFEDFANRSEVSLADESLAMLTNQSYLPYKGYNYDKIMASAYQSLNYIELKDFDKAASELIKLGFYQQNAKQANKRRIELEEKAMRKAQEKSSAKNYDANKISSHPAISAQLKEVYGADYNGNSLSMQAESLYVNPFAYWLGGVYFLNKALDNSDKERAATLFRLASQSLNGKSQTILSDIKTAEDFANGKIGKAPNVTYLIYETGLAPLRRQFRLDLPLYIFQEDLPYVAINFPYLEDRQSYISQLGISADNQSANAELIADMDAIIHKEFSNELPAVIAKGIVSSAIKALAMYSAKKGAGDSWGGALVLIGGTIYQGLANDADLRTWTTLPKQIKIAKINTPASGKINVGGFPLDVSPKGANIVWAKRMSANSPLIIRTFDFTDAKKSATITDNKYSNK